MNVNLTAQKNISGGLIALNRKARHDYEILEEFTCGIILTGSEVKALRAGRCNLVDSYAGPKNGELWLFNMHIGECPNVAQQFQHLPTQPRKLLLKRREISKLQGAASRDGLTLISLRLFFNSRGLCKLLLGLGKGLKRIDKRQRIKERDWNRRKNQVLRGD